MTRTYQSYDERLGPAMTKLALHQPRRVLFGWYCDWCAERCPRSGCGIRLQALRNYRKFSSERDRAQAVQDGYLFTPTETHGIIRPAVPEPVPTTAQPSPAAISRHRLKRRRDARRPSPRPRRGTADEYPMSPVTGVVG